MLRNSGHSCGFSLLCAKSVIKQNEIENGYKIVEHEKIFKQICKLRKSSLKEQNTSRCKKRAIFGHISNSKDFWAIFGG